MWSLAVLVWAGSGASAEGVAVLPLFGADTHGLGAGLGRALHEEGLAQVQAPTVPGDATHCDELPLARTCEDPIVERWRAEPSTARFLVMGSLTPAQGGTDIDVWIFDRDDDDRAAMKELHARMQDLDPILPLVLSDAVARAIAERINPPLPPTRAELEELMLLDEPPEDTERFDPCIEGCCLPYAPPIHVDYEDLRVDLRRDFAEVCRVLPARRRSSFDEPRDLLPMCRRGPVLGYVRPRTWTVASLLVASAGATALAFGQRAAGWDTAGLVLGDHRLGASLTAWGTTAAITTGLLAVGTVALALSDRRRARRYLLREKQRKWLLEAED